jgi:hypothetical protein
MEVLIMKHTHDRTFFDSLNSLSCYWAGFIAADGYIYPPNGGIRIALSEKDKKHVGLFKQIIQSTNPVRCFDTSNGYRCAQIDVYGAYECQEALNKIYHITRAKSLTLRPPNLQNEDDIRHFIRGYMDGDGSISYSGSGHNNHWTLSFISTKEMLEWIKLQIKMHVPDIGNPSVSPDRNVFQLIFGGEQVKRILDWLYKDSISEIRLERKYIKYLEVCEFYKNPRQYGSKYKGVALFKRTGKWISEIKQNGQRFHLGYFKTEKEAALAYNQKAKELGLLDRCYEVV